jgi:4-hydroxy-4-methyl-2-oxoglutarate aldolase
MISERLQAYAQFERVAPDLIQRASKVQAAVLGDLAGRRGVLHGRIQAIGPGMKVCGPAFTVEVRPGDNLMFHMAIALAKPGDVIVVDGKADISCALFGELMVTHAHAAKIGGMVVDGAVRDTGTLAGGPFPIFAAGRSPCGPTKNVPGKLSIPVSAGGVPVSPGDLVIGDEDGVTVIPRADVPGVLAQVEGKLAAEKQRLKEISEGNFVPPWLDDALRAAGVISAGESVT